MQKSIMAVLTKLVMSCIALAIAAPCMADSMNVGAGRCVITPTEPMWMAGYASRKAPSQGKIHDLYAKAIAFEDNTGARSVIVTTDLLGLPAGVSHRTAELIQKRFGIPRDRVMLSSSHTHCGPVLRDNLKGIYNLDEEQSGRVDAYTEALPGLLAKAVAAALDNLEPATVEWGIGEAGFAVNRRKYTPNGVINSNNPTGPVDHDVPVLLARRPDGHIKAVLFGYACHCTTLSFQQFCGDYAGFAQAYIEDALPDTTALFAAGCGGDSNPLPRRSLYLAKHYGEELGNAVLDVLNESMVPVSGPIHTAYEEIELELSEPPTRADLDNQLKSSNVYIQRRAAALIEKWDEQGGLATTYPYPIQVWRFSDSLQLTTLAGEVVVDYSLRLKHELGGERQFVIAYANDVFAYIPSLRVLREGGYEGETAMIYYGLYGPWAPSVEERIMQGVHKLTNEAKELIDVRDAEAVRARRPILIAHRGGVVTPTTPECSRQAIQLAARYNYDMVELDVRESKDHEPVVFHDDTLNEACDVDGAIEDKTVAEIVKLRYVANYETVITLDQALGLCASLKLGVMLDIKQDGSDAFFERIRALLEQHGLTRSTVCINGSPAVRNGLQGAALLRITETDWKTLKEGGTHSLDNTFWFGLPEDLPTRMVAKLQERGALVIPGVNVFRYDEESHRKDAQKDIERLLKAGADGFQIDSAYQDYFGIAMPD